MPQLNIDYNVANKYTNTREHFENLLSHAANAVDYWARIPALNGNCLIVQDIDVPEITHIITHKRYAQSLVNWAKQYLRKNRNSDNYFAALATKIMAQEWLRVIPDATVADWAIQDAIYGEQKYV